MSRMHLRVSRNPAPAVATVCLTATLLLAQPVAAEAAAGRPAPAAVAGMSTRVAVAGYAGDQLANARVIVSVAAARHLPLAAAVLGVATAMGESSLRNISYGDNAINPDGTVADSVGLFQQQHWWGTRAERMTPSYAAAAFYAHLVRVDGWRRMTPTAAIHAVQGNADPHYYTRFVPAAIDVVAYLVQHPGAGRPTTKAGAEASANGGPAASTSASHASPGKQAAPTKPSKPAKPTKQVVQADEAAASDIAAAFPANGGIDLKGLAAAVKAASGEGDWSTTDWATTWDFGSVDAAISGAFTDGLGSDGATVADGTAATGTAPGATGPTAAAADGTAPRGTAVGGAPSNRTTADGLARSRPVPHGTAPGEAAPDGTAVDGTAPEH